ncbi:MAG: hypothetical protein Fur0017_15710 [Anaerolineales bacterium]
MDDKRVPIYIQYEVGEAFVESVEEAKCFFVAGSAQRLVRGVETRKAKFDGLVKKGAKRSEIHVGI